MSRLLDDLKEAGQQNSLERFGQILTEEQIRAKLSGQKSDDKDEGEGKTSSKNVVDASFDDDDDATPF